MRGTLAALATTMLAAAPGFGQAMEHMPGMTMPMPAQPVRKAARKPAPNHAPLPDHAAHGDMPGMVMPMPAKTVPEDRATVVAPDNGTPPPGNAPVPPPPATYYADRSYGAAEMAAARHRMMREDGGRSFGMVLFNLAEYQARGGRDGYRWDGEAWFGGDIDRVALRTEGSGTRREGVGEAEVQALYSRAIGPYYNLQGGVRQDVGARPRRTYLSLGVEGLAPYMFETEARLFLSTRGEMLGRLEAWYDQRITQRLVLQPRLELNLAAQSRRATGIGAGLTDAELGLRLRYEIARKFAPYVGLSYVAETGRTADYSRAAGRDPTQTNWVAGVRAWF